MSELGEGRWVEHCEAWFAGAGCGFSGGEGRGAGRGAVCAVGVRWRGRGLRRACPWSCACGCRASGTTATVNLDGIRARARRNRRARAPGARASAPRRWGPYRLATAVRSGSGGACSRSHHGERMVRPRCQPRISSTRSSTVRLSMAAKGRRAGSAARPATSGGRNARAAVGRPRAIRWGATPKPAMPTASSAARTRRRCSRETPPKAPISCHRPIATTSNTDTGKLWSISPRCGM